MKNTILYSIIFISAFIGTTFGIYTFNNKYVNMFEFDFRDAVEVARADSIAALEIDSFVVNDSLSTENNLPVEEVKTKESLLKKNNELKKKLNELAIREEEVKSLKKLLEDKKTAEYQKWFKATLKLYEAIDVNKARELLKKLPEAEAREIVYSMKKKKAAEILSSLDIETIQRLTRAKK